jgi:hypothetical protein
MAHMLANHREIAMRASSAGVCLFVSCRGLRRSLFGIADHRVIDALGHQTRGVGGISPVFRTTDTRRSDNQAPGGATRPLPGALYRTGFSRAGGVARAAAGVGAGRISSLLGTAADKHSVDSVSREALPLFSGGSTNSEENEYPRREGQDAGGFGDGCQQVGTRDEEFPDLEAVGHDLTRVVDATRGFQNERPRERIRGVDLRVECSGGSLSRLPDHGSTRIRAAFSDDPATGVDAHGVGNLPRDRQTSEALHVIRIIPDKSLEGTALCLALADDLQ